jgi:hypothetical protein
MCAAKQEIAGKLEVRVGNCIHPRLVGCSKGLLGGGENAAVSLARKLVLNWSQGERVVSQPATGVWSCDVAM